MVEDNHSVFFDNGAFAYAGMVSNQLLGSFGVVFFFIVLVGQREYADAIASNRILDDSSFCRKRNMWNSNHHRE